MATGDWSLPRPGCSCIRFTTRAATRHWVGAALAHGSNELNLPHLYFLHYQQVFSATSIWPETVLDVQWSIDPETYGDFASTGQSISASNPHMTNSAIAWRQITAPGTYEFSNTDSTATLALTAFTVGIEGYVVIIRDLRSMRPDRNSPIENFTITRTYSDFFSDARMDALLSGELGGAGTLSDSSPIRSDYPPIPLNSQGLGPTKLGETHYRQKLGTVETSDNNFALQSLFSELGTTPSYYAHAARWLDRRIAIQRHLGAIAPNAAFLAHCKIFTPGRHRYELWPHGLDAVTPTNFSGPCTNLDVDCPAEENEIGTLHILVPPTEDTKRHALFLNSRCAS
jgi:hypothetical protein